LILGGGLRGRRLAAAAIDEGLLVRIVSRSEARRAEIETLGAELFVGDPNRLGTLRGALEGVTVVCWLLGTAGGPPEQLRELDVSRLPAFLGGLVDSTVRGFLYEATPAGAALVREIAQRNSIPAVALNADPREEDLWLAEARAGLSVFL
jgi:hypothetical protein